jgi:hypothetical protein
VKAPSSESNHPSPLQRRAIGARLGLDGHHLVTSATDGGDRDRSPIPVKRGRLGAVRSAVNNIAGHYKLAVGSFKQTPGPWDALERMFVAGGKRDAGTGDKIDDGTRHEHFAGLR